MKKLILLVMALAFALSVFSGAAFAQEEEGAKNLYLAHARDSNRGRPGIKILIELKRDGETRMVPLDYAFRAGDKVKFHFETNFNAYVRVINLGTDGKPQLLYPYQGAPELVTRSRHYAIPQGELWFEFDQSPGTEQLSFIFSSKPLVAEAQNHGAEPPSNQRSVTPTRPGRSAHSNGDEQQALADLNSSSLENGKNLLLVQDSQGNNNSAYGVATAQTLRKPIGIRINLRHQ